MRNSLTGINLIIVKIIYLRTYRKLNDLYCGCMLSYKFLDGLAM